MIAMAVREEISHGFTPSSANVRLWVPFDGDDVDRGRLSTATISSDIVMSISSRLNFRLPILDCGSEHKTFLRLLLLSSHSSSSSETLSNASSDISGAISEF